MAQLIQLGKLADLHIQQTTYVQMEDGTARHPGWPQGTKFYFTSSNPKVAKVVHSPLLWFGQPFQYEVSPTLGVYSVGATTIGCKMVSPVGETIEEQSLDLQVVNQPVSFKMQADQDEPAFE